MLLKLLGLLIFVLPQTYAASTSFLSEELRHALIWSPNPHSQATAFRKTFALNQSDEAIANAKLYLFADTKYMLYLNGKYVARGPCRFDPKAPEFDSLPISKFLKRGNNTFSVLVYGNIDGSGDAMEHDPGLTMKLVVGDTVVKTDRSWKVSDHTRFQAPKATWDGIRENVRADLEVGDWIQPGFNDQKWGHAVYEDSRDWGRFKPRITPLLSETEVPYEIEGAALPLQVQAGTELKLQLKKNIMGYCKFRFIASAGAVLSIFGHHYTAKEGEQEYITADIFGSGAHGILEQALAYDDVNDISVHVKIEKGSILFEEIHVMNAITPLVQVGSFQSSDSLFNRFFEVISNMHQQITQDTYTDGGSEGVEWMGDIFNIFHFTRVAFAMPKADGGLDFADRSYLKKAILDIAASQVSDGRVKARNPTDSDDLHWFIEDFSAYWVMSIRQYFEMTGDRSLVDETFTNVKKQMNWFSSKIDMHGLVNAREWMIFDNPYSYQQGEGATLNALVYKAYRDAAYLSELEGDQWTATQYRQKAKQLKEVFNVRLWNESKKTFNGMPGGKPTPHAAVMSLYTGICSESHKKEVQSWLLGRSQDKIIYPFLHFFWFQDLYDMNTDEADQQVLNIIRSQYGNEWNAYNPGYLTAEKNNGGRNFHNFGMVPGSFFSSDILGVRTLGLAKEKRILIEPRLGDLKFASGKVATENGVVEVSWNRKTNDLNALEFAFQIPNGVTAKVGIPYHEKINQLYFLGQNLIENGEVKSPRVKIAERFIYVEGVGTGSDSGFLR